jgi:Icc-related predicted phosphoesterase
MLADGMYIMKQQTVVAISDLHGSYPHIAQTGDILIIAGDLVAQGSKKEYEEFLHWIKPLKFKNKIVVAGNHDSFLQDNPKFFDDTCVKYLCDSSWRSKKGFTVYGSPWTRSFDGMNPKCKAFCLDTEDELYQKFQSIPTDTDILVTHSPPLGTLDQSTKNSRCGSSALLIRVDSVKPKLHVFGHIHDANGVLFKRHTVYANVAHMSRWYEPINKYKVFFIYDGITPVRLGEADQ